MLLHILFFFWLHMNILDKIFSHPCWIYCIVLFHFVWEKRGSIDASAPGSRRDSIVSESAPELTAPAGKNRSRTPSVDINHPLVRRGSSQARPMDQFDSLEVRCKSGAQKRRVSQQSEGEAFKVQLKHREADAKAGFSNLGVFCWIVEQ